MNIAAIGPPAYQGAGDFPVMLTMTFLGVGSAFAKKNYNSNCLFEYWERPGRAMSPRPPDDTLLVDFGVTIPMALYDS